MIPAVPNPHDGLAKDDGMGPALRFALLVLALPLGFGCKGKPDKLLPVSGKVTYRGFALQQGTVVFSPDTAKGTQGEIAVGEIGRDGTFSLRTGNAMGAPVGNYRVTVAAVVAESAPIPGQVFRTPVSLLPDRYSDPELSGITCSVTQDRANNFTFELQ